MPPDLARVTGRPPLILHARDTLPAEFRGGAVALGNFDGFHAGHQAVVAGAVALARRQGVPTMVATFDPHPVRLFRPDAPPFRLTTIDQRARLFAEAGADATLVIDFNGAFASLDAPAFERQFLIERLAVAGVVTGEDFVYGRGRGGNGDTLARAAERGGFAYTRVAALTDVEGAISSSRIREALRRGDCDSATRLLTRPFAIEGVVEHGAKLGRQLGYPTANLSLGDYLRPRYGIYAVRARMAGEGTWRPGVANIGVRPTIEPPVELLETYLFDFHGDLYDRAMEVQLIAHLRDEAKFDGLDALVEQMRRDEAQARALLGA